MAISKQPASPSGMTWAERLRQRIAATSAESEGSAPVPSRRSFLRRSSLSLAAIPAVLAVTSTAKAASKTNTNSAPYRDQFLQIREHENYHVDALLQALGSDARPKPTFKNLAQKDFASFHSTSQALENTGVGAYLGASPFIDDSDYLTAAGTIAFIEARHAGFLNYTIGDPITGGTYELDADRSFEYPLTPTQVAQGASGFIKSLNGGPPLTYSDTPSAENDIAILNFALALEYLEAEYYNINYPIFYG